MRRFVVFAVGSLAQACLTGLTLGIAYLLVHALPEAFFPWASLIIGILASVIAVVLYRELAKRGLAFLALVGVLYVGRVLAGFVTALLVAARFPSAFVEIVSLQLFVLENGRIALARTLFWAPFALVIPYLGYRWGRRRQPSLAADGAGAAL